MNRITPDTCIIVPCYNEAKRLNTDKIIQYSTDNPGIDFLFVNDGSTDNTLNILKELCDCANNISYLELSQNSGKAEAVRSGFIQAMQNNYSYLGYFDADLSTPLDQIDRLKRVLDNEEGIEIAIGSRVKMLGYDIDRKLVRHLAGRIFATVASIALKLPIYDTQCGAKLFINNSRLKILFSDKFIGRWTLDAEIIRRHMILVSLEGDSGHRIEEVPLKTWKHIPGSKVNPADFMVSTIGMLNIANRYRKQSTVEYYRQLLSHQTASEPDNYTAS
jgi:glycosyltransferase involved in cell wall biosynthesis